MTDPNDIDLVKVIQKLSDMVSTQAREIAILSVMLEQVQSRLVVSPVADGFAEMEKTHEQPDR